MSMLQRLYQFRGINRSLQPNGLDASSAYDAVNVDIVGGKLTNKTVGSIRLVSRDDVPAARPIIYYGAYQKYLILRDKYIALGNGYTIPNYTLFGDANCDGRVTAADAAAIKQYDRGIATLPPQGLINADVNMDGDVNDDDADMILQNIVKIIDFGEMFEELGGNEVGMFEPDLPEPVTPRPLEDVVNDSAPEFAIRGVGRGYVYSKIDNNDVVIASGMLDTGSGYEFYRDYLVDGFCKTAVYYLGTETPAPKIHCRQFGSGQFMAKDMEITAVATDPDTGCITAIQVDSSMSQTEIDRAKLDGIFLFDSTIGASPLEDKIDDAVMWLEVTDVVEVSTRTLFVVNTKRTGPEVNNLYVAIRGQCSDVPITWMVMHNGRLFASAHRGNREHPRRLYWSCLPGDGRTIEDWTSTEASIDTSGGHVDIGDPSDEYITGMVELGEQILIFTKYRLWRLYGYSPSNYVIELVGELEGTRISNAIEVNGIVYWLSLSGISYYNGSSIAHINDNGSFRNLINSFPNEVKDSMMYSTVHTVMFDGSLMFSFDRYNVENECMIVRYDLNTGNVIKYVVPCTNFLQQFTDAVKGNFGKEDGVIIQYETRYFQSMVHKTWNADTEQYDYTMTMTQWYDWGRSEHGWYDDQKVKSLWQSWWTDFGAPEAFKKPVDVYMRGEGNFDLTLESDVNKETINVTMPDRHEKVRDVASHVSGGRSFRMTVETDEPFEIEPYMTIKFDSGAIR